MDDYKPNFAKDGIDRHVKRTTWLLYFTIAGFAAIALVALKIFTGLSPGDPDLLWRWLTERYVRVFFCDAALLCLFQFIQWYTNGNLLKRILQDSRACAYVLAALILGNVLLLIGG